MKNKLYLPALLCLIAFAARAAKPVYFLVTAPANQGFEVDKVETLWHDQFGQAKVDFHAELYNLHLKKDKLVLFTVLPAANDGLTHWQRIDPDTVRGWTVNARQIDSIADGNINLYRKGPVKNIDQIKSLAYRLIIKCQDDYYENTSLCFTEFFSITQSIYHSGFPNQNPAFSIDTTIEPLSVSEYEGRYFRQNNGIYSSNFLFSENQGELFVPIEFRQPVLLYAHSTVTIHLKASLFWVLSYWQPDAHLNDLLRRGIDRFYYNTEVGIIAGDYTAFFARMCGIDTYQYKNAELHRYLTSQPRLMPVTITRHIEH